MRTILLDACLAITFGNAQRLDLITDLSTHRAAIGARARREVVKPPAPEELDRAVHSGTIEVVSVDLSNADEQQALARFDGLPAFRGRGDAEVLALATTRGYLVGSDERAIRRVARQEVGRSRLVSTLDIIVLAARDGRISIREGRALLERLDVGPAYLRALNEKGLRLEDLV